MTRFLRAIGIAAVVVVAVWVSSGVEAGIILDQSQTSYDAAGGFLDDVQGFAQTFTVGQSGRLSGIDVAVCCSNQPNELRLLATSSGAPTSSLIATSSAIPLWNGLNPIVFTYFDFSNYDINVMAGDVLAFQPFGSGSIGMEIVAQDGNTYPHAADSYPGGQEFFYDLSVGLASWTPFESYLTGQGSGIKADAAFRTYVDVPEPSTLALFGFGLLGLAGMRVLRLKSSCTMNDRGCNEGHRAPTGRPDALRAGMGGAVGGRERGLFPS